MALGDGLSSLIPKKKTDGAPTYVPAQRPVPSPAPAPARPAPAAVPSGFSRDPFSQRPHPQERPAPAHHEVAPKKPVPKDESVFQIEVEKIRPNPLQPRQTFDDGDLEDLASSIREFGILQPLVVAKEIRETETGTAVEYQLVAGERRLRAAKLAGLERVPVIIRNVGKARVKLELALIENLQRSNLGSLETARAYARLSDEFGLTQREIAARVGKSREVVANTMRLLNLPPAAQDALASGRINESQARTLLTFPTPEEQLRALERLMREGLSVRELRNTSARPTPPANPEDSFWAKRIEERLGAPVRVSRKNGHGKVTIEFYSDEEWRALMEKLGGDERDS